MSLFQRVAPLAATLLLSAATTAAMAEPVAPAAPGTAATQGQAQPQAPAAPQERLRIGLTESDAKLVLPWFVTELTDAVNQGKPLNETGKALVNGF
ncbi:hypothetical protein [Achromobacter xylosoxidans]|uniref:hypothetical protein n=1 Tax=Alcaligenes xylosoxydans xylosoxydans TaxID=85698 RepID=UPI0022B8962C|nr:hypothetical protein [Achromobacter xylosoxidans]MCZ8391790.1 hypothetical protein [Achromobacter xylosoxidans]